MLARLIFVTAIAGIPLAFGWWEVRTCRALWRRGTTEWGRLVYDLGVRCFGVRTAIVRVGLGGYCGAEGLADSSGDAARCAIAGALLGAAFGTPIALGMGYCWGAQRAWMYRLEPAADRPSAQHRQQPRPIR